MKTIIFKNEKKSKVYEIKAAKSFHIYSAGELIYRVKTDKIENLNENFTNDQITITEIK